MALRRNPVSTGYYYHVFNRGVDKQIIFKKTEDYKRFLQTIAYYQYKPPIKLSEYARLQPEARADVKRRILQTQPRIAIASFCFMPNHFHFLLKQQIEEGISLFLKDILGSYTRYFNTKYKRKGHLCESQCHAVLIESDEELLHVSRYIHLNPYTAHLTEHFQMCMSYPWSSLRYYLQNSPSFVDTKTILFHFGEDANKYRSFVEDQKTYQRTLAAIKSDHRENE